MTTTTEILSIADAASAKLQSTLAEYAAIVRRAAHRCPDPNDAERGVELLHLLGIPLTEIPAAAAKDLEIGQLTAAAEHDVNYDEGALQQAVTDAGAQKKKIHTVELTTETRNKMLDAAQTEINRATMRLNTMSMARAKAIGDLAGMKAKHPRPFGLMPTAKQLS
jgi:hypothetical protein